MRRATPTPPPLSWPTEAETPAIQAAFSVNGKQGPDPTAQRPAGPDLLPRPVSNGLLRVPGRDEMSRAGRRRVNSLKPGQVSEVDATETGRGAGRRFAAAHARLM